MELYCSNSWLKKISKLRISSEEVVRLLCAHGPTVDRSEDWALRYNHMVIGEIVEVSDHPNADALRLVKTDIGEKNVQIVCGGSNLEKGQKVVVALPGAKVRWHGEGDLVELSETKIRGEKSFGMICGANEVGLEKWFPHDMKEIMNVSHFKVKAGDSLAEALMLDDVVYEIEATSNRVDVMSMEGVARELMATKGKVLQVSELAPIQEGEEKLVVTVDEGELCSRYQAVKIDNVKIGPSPLWMQSALFKAGIKPINNLVDISNYVMLEQGQPLHAFDGEKVEEIVVRLAKDGEEFLALDDESYTLNDSMLVITDGEVPIAIAGVMGGKESGISDLTNSVVWESANFDPVSVRKTSRELLLFSESQTRFDKGLSPVATERALRRAVALTLEIAGGEVVSEVVDVRSGDYSPQVYAFDTDDIKRITGVDVPLHDARGYLECLGFDVDGEGVWNVTVPYWREGDIEDAQDLVEEIIRMYGYHRVEGTLPKGVSLIDDGYFRGVRGVCEYLRGKGLSEMISYSMVSAEDIERLGDDSGEYVRVANALTRDAEYLRVSMVSSALQAVKRNEVHTSAGGLFEIASLFTKTDALPEEDEYVMCVMWDMKPDQPLFYCLKGVLAGLFDAQYEPVQLENLHDGRTALIMVEDKEVGVVGEVHPFTLKQFDVDSRVVVCQLRMDVLLEVISEHGGFSPVAEFPGVKRDIAFFIDERALYEDINDALMSAHGLVKSVELFDVYQGKGVPEGKKSMAFHIEYRDSEKTLEAEEAEKAHEVVLKVIKKLGGEMRS